MTQARTINVLHVEDNAIGRYAVGHVLRRAGFAVTEAADGAGALSRAKDIPDLILLDVHLPDIDGFEVCRRLKADPATAAIPVLHLSATSATTHDRTTGLEGGASGYLVEPVDGPLLVATIKALVRLRLSEQSERLAARHWQTVFEAIAEGVCLIDETGRIQRCNKALLAMIGKPEAELLGQEYAVWLPGLALEGGVELLAGLRKARRRLQGEVALGTRRLAVKADPVLANDGSLAGAVLVLGESA